MKIENVHQDCVECLIKHYTLDRCLTCTKKQLHRGELYWIRKFMCYHAKRECMNPKDIVQVIDHHEGIPHAVLDGKGIVWRLDVTRVPAVWVEEVLDIERKKDIEDFNGRRNKSKRG